MPDENRGDNRREEILRERRETERRRFDHVLRTLRGETGPIEVHVEVAERDPRYSRGGLVHLSPAVMETLRLVGDDLVWLEASASTIRPVAEIEEWLRPENQESVAQLDEGTRRDIECRAGQTITIGKYGMSERDKEIAVTLFERLEAKLADVPDIETIEALQRKVDALPSGDVLEEMLDERGEVDELRHTVESELDRVDAELERLDGAIASVTSPGEMTNEWRDIVIMELSPNREVLRLLNTTSTAVDLDGVVIVDHDGAEHEIRNETVDAYQVERVAAAEAGRFAVQATTPLEPLTIRLATGGEHALQWGTTDPVRD